MSRWVLAAAIILASTAYASAQGNPNQNQNQNQDGWAHKMLVDQQGKPAAGHDFGVVPLGAQLHYTFKISNPYNPPLGVFIKTSCDCVKATASKQTLNKLESGTIEIDMDGRRFNGVKSVNVFVTVQDPQRQYTSTAVLTISATSRQDIVLNPGSVSFGIVPRGQEPSKSIEVTYAGALNWQIVATPPSELFEIDVRQGPQRPGQIGYQIALKLKSNAPIGTFKQDLVFRTNDPANPTFPVPFDITVQPKLLVYPNNLIKVSSAKVGTEVRIQPWVQGTSNFKIVELEGLGDGLELVRPLTSDSKPTHRFELKFTGTQPGPFSRKITIKTDGDKDLTATFTVEGNVLP